MDQTTLNEILRKHRLWLKDDPNGERADLVGADLRGANLEDADLRGANLIYADLRYADLKYAFLKDANLRHAYLTQTISQNIGGQKIISVQVDTSRVNNAISYWKDLNPVSYTHLTLPTKRIV